MRNVEDHRSKCALTLSLTLILLSGGCFAQDAPTPTPSPPKAPSADLMAKQEKSDKGELAVEDFTGYWRIEVEGTVLSVNRENIDKSGRNPKWKISFTMQVESPNPELLPPGYELTDQVPWSVKSTDLARMNQEEPRVGDRLRVTGQGDGLAPRSFGVKGLSRL